MGRKLLIIIIATIVSACMKKQDHQIIHPDVPTYSLEGIVTDEFHQVPIDGMEVKIFKEDSMLVSSTATNEEGYFKLEDITFDNEGKVFKICFSKYGYSDVDRIVGFNDKNSFLEFSTNRVLVCEGVFDVPGSKPSGICWNGNYIWTVDYNDKTLYSHDSYGNVIESHSLPYGIYPRGLSWDGSNFWMVSFYDKEVLSLSQDFNTVTFRDTLLYETPFGDEPPIDIAIKEDTLIACDIFTDYITLHSTKNTNIYYRIVNKGGVNGEIVDPSGTVFAENGYYIICETSKIILTDVNFNIIDKYTTDIEVGSLVHLDYDGEYLWCIDNTYNKYYKFNNTFY